MPFKPLPFTASLLAVALLTACQSTTVSTASTIKLPQAFEQTHASHGSAKIDHWWQQWNDPVLSGLIEQGLQQSHDIRIAQSRLQKARATTRLANAETGPTVGLNANATRLDARIRNPLDTQARAALAQIPQTAALGQRNFTLEGDSFTGGFIASWEPDIFGQKRSDADAARHAEMGVQEKLYGAQMLLAGDIAENYFKARAAQTRLQTAERSISTLQRMVRYVESRFKAGHVTAHEVNQARMQLNAVQAKHSTIAAEYAAYVRSIAVLTGQTPQGFTLPEGRADILAEQPDAPSGQTPEGMLERRPDIRAHAAQVNAYAAKLASAKADLLPRFSISFLGQGSISVDGATDLKGWGSLLRLGIQVPIFTNGRIKANIAAADARLQTALLQYDRNILQALGEVDTAYQTHTALTRQNALLKTAYEQAAKQATDAEALFKYGKKTLDETLRAQLNEQNMHNTLTQSRLARAQTLVGLYKALGGGWTANQ